MKKTIAVISAVVLAFSVALTACSKSNTLTDKNGYTHVICTDKQGVTVQNKWGNLYEVVTDKDGKEVTQEYAFPEISTNKSCSVIENAAVQVKVPSKWKFSKNGSLLRIRHKGDCTSNGEPACQIDFEFTTNLDAKETYEEYKQSVINLNTITPLIDPKDYETDVLGKKAFANRYQVPNSNTIVYYYCIEDGELNIEITACVYNNCYTEEKLVELINSCTVVKPLGDGSNLKPAAVKSTTQTTANNEQE